MGRCGVKTFKGVNSVLPHFIIKMEKQNYVKIEGKLPKGKLYKMDEEFIFEQIKKIKKSLAEHYFEMKRLNKCIEELQKHENNKSNN